MDWTFKNEKYLFISVSNQFVYETLGHEILIVNDYYLYITLTTINSIIVIFPLVVLDDVGSIDDASNGSMDAHKTIIYLLPSVNRFDLQ